MRRQQLLTGFLLMLAAAFIRHAPSCGLLGAWTADGLYMLLGRYGTTLLVVALAGAAIAVAMPAIVGKILLAIGKAASENASSLATRARARVRRRAMPGAATRVPARPRTKGPEKAGIPFRPPLPQEDELRASLRHLGYRPGEIDSVLPRLDNRGGFEGMVRQALALLRTAA